MIIIMIIIIIIIIKYVISLIIHVLLIRRNILFFNIKVATYSFNGRMIFIVLPF